MTTAFGPADLAVAERLLTTTRAIRRRLDLECPVDLDVVHRCLRIALHAPTGSNLQQWRWVIVQDEATRHGLAQLFRRPYEDAAISDLQWYLEQNDDARASMDAGQRERLRVSTRHLADVIEHVPVLVVPCIEAPTDRARHFVMATVFASIYPAVWSLQLALRAHGLGSVLTTQHLLYADEAAALLGIPDGVVQAALLPIAHIVGNEVKPATRAPAEDVVFLDRWGSAFDCPSPATPRRSS
jgi:nitroreductase